MKGELGKRIVSSFVILPLSFYFIISGSFFFNFFLITCYFITSYEWYNMTKEKKYHIFGYLFLFFSFFSAYILRNDSNDNSSLGIFLLVIIICIATDIGGYVAGKTFKGPKLSKISPNKTYSGMIGGYFLSIIIIYIFINISELFLNLNLSLNFKVLFFIIIISSVSQIGDIIVSYFKRLSNIKDTGKIIPGHGGLLDRIDGMIFAFPFSYLIFLMGYNI